MLKFAISISFIFLCFFANGQRIDSIYVHLYTDSLKKGTYNYINIDGRLSNGRFVPLDTTQVTFTATAGEFHGNSLLVDAGFEEAHVTITVTLKQNPAVHKIFDMPIKQKPDNEVLKTTEEILQEMKHSKKKKN
ncbi:MAG TPA: hypothetical protein PKC39_10345 [Ferruginibacter sp.]|nr:hypothetical protein [Ferruginibacter sp.]HMP21350.1 hypothetical protein [Ferruginibacter sp.]